MSAAPLTIDEGLAVVRTAVGTGDHLVRAIATGRRRGSSSPDPERAELRMVQVDGVTLLQVVGRTGPLVRTFNHQLGAELSSALEELLAQPYGNWHVQSTSEQVQVRFTRRGKAFVHTEVQAAAQDLSHDQQRHHLLDPGDPLFTVLGAGGDKRRQVDAFLRILQAAIATAQKRNELPADGSGLGVIDLGCGNAVLTLAAHRYLQEAFPGTVTVGVERRADLIARSAERAMRAGLSGVRFVHGDIGTDPGLPVVHVALALHACDTATDDALAQAVSLQAPVILAAPCCHHDIQRQLREQWSSSAPGPDPYRAVTGYPILRERFADVLTDTFRAGLLREQGYSVDVSEFVDSKHTPRNAIIRAVAGGPRGAQDQTRELIEQWRLRPRLGQLLPTRSAT